MEIRRARPEEAALLTQVDMPADFGRTLPVMSIDL